MFLSWRGSGYGEPCTVTNAPEGVSADIGSVVYIAGARMGYGLNIFQLLICVKHNGEERKAFYRIRTGAGGYGWSAWKEL